ncbi:MAG TPA: transglycosylase SLT domain-containing protein [Pyrinomonadaceae bacterium]|jgi:soluble lytic murein transglycosylase
MLHAKLSAVFFIVLFAVSVSAQDFPQKIRGAIENRDYAAAIAELENLRRENKKVFELNNYDYLLARAAEKRGDFAAAMANYQSVVARNSVLREYALWHLSQIARASGNLMLERVYLNELLTTAPNSLLIQAATARRARSNFESKDFDAAIRQLSGSSGGGQPLAAITDNKSKTIAAIVSSGEPSRENLVLIGQSYLQSGKAAEGREIFTKLITNLPNPAQPDDYALIAAKTLDEMDSEKGSFGKTAPRLADLEHFRRAKIYQFNRDFADARLHFTAIVERFPQSPNLPEALYQIGRGYASDNNFNEAIKWFERVSAEFPEDAFARDGLSQAANAYARVNKPKEALTRYQRFIEKYAGEETSERAYLNIIDILRDTGEDTDAVKWAQKTREAFKGALPEALAVFAQARVHLAKNDWQSALNDLNELQNFPDLGGTRVAGATNKAEISFLKGYALEQMQRDAEAIDVYLSIPDGRAEYYGWRATERLKGLANDERAKPLVAQKLNQLATNIEGRNAEAQRKAAQGILRLTDSAEMRARMLEIVRQSYQTLPEYQKIPNAKLLEFGRREVLKEARKAQASSFHQTLADELLFLGLYDEGAPELETALREKLSPNVAEKLKSLAGMQTNANNLSVFPADTAYTLAVFYKRGDMANRAVSYVEPLWRNVPADYQIELIPREQIEILYPAPYRDALLQHAPERNLDPRLVLSIMRQESRYRAEVKSYAAARGLMQFISATANQIAGELGRKNFQQDELYNPPVAVLFGSQYLQNLFRMFPNQPQAVAASYNGGETNMQRWLARAKSDQPDRYVPEILFSQSKDYVYRVMANYRVYQLIYDENLKAR